MTKFKFMIAALVLITLTAAGQQATEQTVTVSQTTNVTNGASASTGTPTTMDGLIDRIIQREHELMTMLNGHTPLVETYLQDVKMDPVMGISPKADHYFLGKMDLGATVERRDFLSKDPSMESSMLGGITKLFKFEYHPMGFSWMIFADRENFDREHYDFQYVRREFLGNVRCLLFEVKPKPKSGNGRFEGRIWVEDQDFNIVRLNGTFVPRPRNAYFFHMDSWRLNVVPGFWVPAYIYSEEGDFSYGAKENKVAFKAQTRLWSYQLGKDDRSSELTEMLVDSSVKDDSPATQDSSPLQAQRQWQQQAEDNVLERLQKAGLLAPEGDIDKVLETVANNLLITNNVELPRPVRARVMLTSPLETFSVGNTIVVSRGLLDVLPDEACLAMVISHELGHIVLGHNTGSKYGFSDRMLFSDQATYRNMGFSHSPQEEDQADQKALDLLKNSPYSQKLDSAGLFLKQLVDRAPGLTALLTPHLGNSFTDDKGVVRRMAALMNTAPALEPNKLSQVAALPLGGRVRLNPWDNRVELIKAAPVSIMTARDKMPFEVTPFFPRLTRYGIAEDQSASANSPDATPTKDPGGPN
jgi:Peptidase family M48